MFKITSIFFLCCSLHHFTANAIGLYWGLNEMFTERVHVVNTEVQDPMPVIILPEVVVYPTTIKFKNEKEQIAYDKLVRDVKRTLPYAKLVYNALIETYEYIETLPNDKTKEAHLKRMEKELFKEYKPELKKLTLTQGKLLLKLIDRECNQSSFKLVNAFLGPLRARFWNVFATMLGASLKTTYEPNGQDAITEHVVRLVERGKI